MSSEGKEGCCTLFKGRTSDSDAIFTRGDTEVLRARYSFFFLDGKNAFRRICVTIDESPWFNHIITGCILVNSGLLASKLYDENYDPNFESRWNDLLEYFDLVFTFIFILECVIKIAAMGFYRHPGSYLKDYWNWLDFSIVLVSIISLSPAAK